MARLDKLDGRTWQLYWQDMTTLLAEIGNLPGNPNGKT